MSWNSAHENHERYKHPEVQAAYAAFLDAQRTFNAQMKYCKRGANTDHLQGAWNRFLRLRKQHGDDRRLSDS